MSNKNLITLTVPTTDDKDRVYVGRFLGFIKDDEFNALAQERKVATKIESKETKDIVAICRSSDELEGLRLILAVKKVDGKNVKGKKLFVSDKLLMVREVLEKEVTFMLEDGAEDMVAEEKV